GPGGLLLDRFDLDVEADLVGHEQAARLEGDVPLETPVLAVHLDGGAEPGAGAAPRVLHGALVLEVPRDLPGHAVHGEVAGERELVALRLDPLRDELDLRVLLDVEEVGVAEVLVAPGVAAADAGGVDRRGYGRLERVVGDRDRPLEVAEDAADLGD